MKIIKTLIIFLSFGLFLRAATAEQCGKQANGALCPNGLCCSEFGWCGDTDPYCGNNCQSQCRRGNPTPTPSNPSPTPTGSGDVGRIITPGVFDEMLKYRNDPRCPSNGFYTYNAFLNAARSFNGFGTTGDDATRRRELAAFLAQTSHETTGGWATAPDGPYAWGYCHIRELNQDIYCTPDPQWPCAPGQRYYGRGPIQLTHNYNYGQAGRALGLNILNNPDQVATDPVISFRTAIWFWMTPQGNKPSSHNVIVGNWRPSDADRAAGRVPGYGVITNIINGGLECGRGQDPRVVSRIGFYRRKSRKKWKKEGGATMHCDISIYKGQRIWNDGSISTGRRFIYTTTKTSKLKHKKEKKIKWKKAESKLSEGDGSKEDQMEEGGVGVVGRRQI